MYRSVVLSDKTEILYFHVFKLKISVHKLTNKFMRKIHLQAKHFRNDGAATQKQPPSFTLVAVST